MNIQKAERRCAKLRLALTGPSGAGKTYSALLLARGLVEGAAGWGKILVIDTENNSSHMYAALGEYCVLSLIPPYSPERYIEAIQTGIREGYDVIIIDGLSAEWNVLVSFAGSRSASRSVSIGVSVELQVLLWQMIGRLPPLERDFMQEFELSAGFDMKRGILQRIVHRQKKPFCEATHDFPTSRPTYGILLAIDDGNGCSTLLWADEY